MCLVFCTFFLVDGRKANVVDERKRNGKTAFSNKREKTLQGISPDWDLITSWIAPVSQEKRLHKMFKNKRLRGEWFDLNFGDLELIKEEMDKYKND